MGKEEAWIVSENAKPRMKMFAVGQFFSRDVCGLLMVLVGYGSDDNRFRVSERVVWMVCHSDYKHIHQLVYHFFATEQTFIHVHAWGSRDRCSVINVLHYSLDTWSNLNWLNNWDRRKNVGADCRDGCM